MKAPGILLAVSMLLHSGCGATLFYQGPRRPAESVARVSTPTKEGSIARVDGREANVSLAELLPGMHEIEFSWSTRRRMGGFVPVLSSSCYVKAKLEAGSRYELVANDVEESIGRQPPLNVSWTLYRVAPELVDRRSGEKVDGLLCNPTCRAYSRKGREETTVDCRDVLEPRFLAAEGSFTPESAALAKIIFDRLWGSCSTLRGMEEAECQARRVQNDITYLAGDGTLLIFYPADDTRLRPGLTEEARQACVVQGDRVGIPACLEGYGWVLLP